jgi:hypothetical protein
MAYFALAALMPVSGAMAQKTLPEGARVRVTAPEIAEEPIFGVVSSLDPAFIKLTVPRDRRNPERMIPLSSVSRIEVYRGRKHSPLPGMGTGLLIGAGIGLGIGVAAATENDNWVCDGAECIFGGALGGGLWGVIIGGLFGAAFGQEQWDEVTLVGPRVSVQPAGGGFALAVSLGF